MASPFQRLGSLTRLSSPTCHISHRARRKAVQNGIRSLSGTASLREDRRPSNPKNVPKKPRALWRNPYLDIMEESNGLVQQKDYQPKSEDVVAMEQQIKEEIGDDVQAWAQRAHNELGALGFPSVEQIIKEFQNIDAQSEMNEAGKEMQEPPPPKVDKSNDYEPDDELEEEDPDFEPDDISSNAHLELEQVRELRHLSRVIVWDMPLLYEHRKDFQVPTAATPLKFRYTTYLGEVHPAARKVVVSFKPTELPDLSPVQVDKLIKLLGVRYNPSTATAKLSSENFPTVAQNKRYLGDLVDKLLVEARDGKDTFADLPFDFRHHRPKKQYVFPEEWKLTEQRHRELAARGREQPLLEDGRGTEEDVSAVDSQREHELVEAMVGNSQRHPTSEPPR